MDLVLKQNIDYYTELKQCLNDNFECQICLKTNNGRYTDIQCPECKMCLICCSDINSYYTKEKKHKKKKHKKEKNEKKKYEEKKYEEKKYEKGKYEEKKCGKMIGKMIDNSSKEFKFAITEHIYALVSKFDDLMFRGSRDIWELWYLWASNVYGINHAYPKFDDLINEIHYDDFAFDNEDIYFMGRFFKYNISDLNYYEDLTEFSFCVEGDLFPPKKIKKIIKIYENQKQLVQNVVVTWMLIWKYEKKIYNMPKEIALMIAYCIWNTRAEPEWNLFYKKKLI